MKLLIIRLGAIGDVVHSNIIPQAIKQKYPDYEIDFLTTDYIAPLIKNNKFISKVIPASPKLNLIKAIMIGYKLRSEKYDIVINLTNSLKNIVIAKLAGGKIYKRNKNRVHAVDAFYNTALDIFENLEKPLSIQLGVNKKIIEELKEKLKEFSQPIIIFSPGGQNDKERQGRIWRDEYWVELGESLVKKYNATILIVGSKTEKTKHEKFSKIPNSIVFSGELTLEESAALFSLADLFISGDSGPLHIADAVGCRTIALMGSTNPIACAGYSSNAYYIEPQNDCK